MSNRSEDVRPVIASKVAPRVTKSNYPAPFAARMNGRIKRPLGVLFGLNAVGVNLTTLDPGAVSALHHAHSRQDEFIYVIEGQPTVVIGEIEHLLEPRMCVGFPAGGPAHHLHNRSDHPATYLEFGDRTAGDQVDYPSDDLRAEMGPNGWTFTHKDGRPW